jgi:uncharacterized oxidoreductase
MDGGAVLVTGGTSGIGLALVRRLHSCGCGVLTCGRDRGRLEALEAELPGVVGFEADLGTTEGTLGLAAAVLKEAPRLRAVIHNAAVQVGGALEDASPAAIQTEIGTNLTAPVLLTRALLPALKAAGRSRIVFVTSGLAIAPKSDAAVYCATKAALSNLTRGLRLQLRGTGVSVHEAVMPIVDTPMTAGRGDGMKISAGEAADALLNGLARDEEDIRIGLAKRLWMVNRLSPALAGRIMARS